MNNQLSIPATIQVDATEARHTWDLMRDQAKLLIATGFLPSAIKTAEQAVMVMMKGKELGIPSLYALSNINVIQGKPAASAELLLAIIYRDQGDDALIFTETSATKATAKYKRRSWREYQTFTFDTADAKRAGLTGGNWDKYPGAMLRARCISAIARLAFPDSIGGMYTPEELGAIVDVETGEIIDSAPISTPALRQQAEEPQQAPSLTERIAAPGPQVPAHVDMVRARLAELVQTLGKERVRGLCNGLTTQYPNTNKGGLFDASRLSEADAAEVMEILAAASEPDEFDAPAEVESAA